MTPRNPSMTASSSFARFPRHATNAMKASSELSRERSRFHPGLLAALAIGPFAFLAPLASAGTGHAATSTAAEKLVIEAGRIITQAGPDVVDGLIVIENGRITAIGRASEIEKPWDATVLGGPEFVAFPGFVEAHSSEGMDRPNENVDVTPFLDVRDSIDPVAYFFEDCLRWGITTVNIQQGPNCIIGARGMVVRPVGMTVEEMMVRPNFGLKLAAAPKSGRSRATQRQALRSAFRDLKRYLEDLVEKESDERGYASREALFQGREFEGEKAKGRPMGGTTWKVEGLETIPRGAIDEKWEPLLDLVEGQYQVFFYCAQPMDVPAALEVARENGFLARTTLVIEEDCWKAADLIAEAGVPVVLDDDLVHIERDPVTGEEIETFVPGILAEKGIRFALSSKNANTNSLWFQASLAIGLGLDRALALDSVTKVPAEILGMGRDIGSLEVGKLANVVLFSGDPLDVTSWVDRVVVEGREVYDRSEDVRFRQILEGAQPPGTAASATADEGAEDEEQGGEDDEEKDDGPVEESDDGEGK